MFSLFKRSNADKQVPEWASFFKKTEYHKFISHLNGYFSSKHISFTLGEGEVHLKDLSFGAERLGLLNLAQMCKQLPNVNWETIIAEHFDRIHTNTHFENTFEKQVHDFAFAKEFLGVRLYHNEYVANIKEGLTIGKQLTDDIFALLVFDFPQSVRNVKIEETIQWNKTNEELFEIGIANIKAKYEFEVSKQEVGALRIWFAQGGHFFVPNIVFDLKEKPALVGSKGSLIGIPHRHAVLIYPIENVQTVEAINLLIPIIFGMEKEGPGSISNSLYWYHNNQFTMLPYKLEENTLQFYPPEAFIEMLQTLESKS